MLTRAIMSLISKTKKRWKRLKESNNETLSIFVSTSVGIVLTPFFIGFEGLAAEEITYGLITLFGFISASSYLGKAIGKIIQHFAGEESNIFNWYQQLFSQEQKLNQIKTRKKNIEGFATLAAFIIGTTAIAIPILVLDPGFSAIFQSLFIPGFAEAMFAFSVGGITSSLFSRTLRFFDHSAEERKKTFRYYYMFVGLALVLSLAVLIVGGILTPMFPVAAPMLLFLAKSAFNAITIMSTSVSLFNYFGHVFDHLAQRKFTNEILGTMAGIFLGIVIGAVIATSSLATGGIAGIGIISAVGFSYKLGLVSHVLGKIAFAFFWASITTGFCKRMGTLFDKVIWPQRNIFHALNDLFTDKAEVKHSFPLSPKFSSFQHIDSALKQHSNGYHQYSESSNDALLEHSNSRSFSFLFDRRKTTVKSDSDQEHLLESKSFQSTYSVV